MPISMRVDRARNVSYATATGVVTDADLRQLCARILSDPEYDPTADHIFDGNGIERLEVSPATLQEAAQLFARADRHISKGTRPKVAIVAPADAAFGLARMYETYREMQASPKRYLVCRTMTEARRWIGLPEEEAVAAGATARDADLDRGPRVVPVKFRDAGGVHWTVAPRLVQKRGADVVPDGFEFVSEGGERRFLRWDPKNFLSPREVDHATWRELLRTATVVT
jgi:hypothetical protein